jgi:hypothetical protein
MSRAITVPRAQIMAEFMRGDIPLWDRPGMIFAETELGSS